MAGRQLFKASLDINASAFRRAVEMLRGAPKRVHNHRLSVGIHEEEAHAEKKNYQGQPTHTELIEAAYAHEFGTAGLPTRSFLRTWYDQNIERLKKESTEAMRREYEGDTEAVDALAHKWGLELFNWLIRNEAGLEPLSAKTIEERQKAGLPDGPPLVATTQLALAIRAMADGQYY